MPNRSRKGAERRPARGEPVTKGARGGSAVEDDVDRKVLHGGVEDFLHGTRKPVNFVDKKKGARGESRQDPDQVSPLFERRSGRGQEGDAHGPCDQSGEGRFSQTGRTVQKNMVQRVFPEKSRLDGYFQAVDHVLLPDIMVEGPRSQEVRVGNLLRELFRNQKIGFIGFQPDRPPGKALPCLKWKAVV